MLILPGAAVQLNENATRHGGSLTPTAAGAALATGVAYWVYWGQAPPSPSPLKMYFNVTTIAATVTAAEYVLASTPLPPSRAAKVLTPFAKLDNTNSGIVLTTTGIKLSNAIGTPPANAFVWAGIRVAATTPPQIYGLTNDMMEGAYQTTLAAGVLAVGTPYTGVVPAQALTWQCPALCWSMD